MKTTNDKKIVIKRGLWIILKALGKLFTDKYKMHGTSLIENIAVNGALKVYIVL